MAWDDAYRAFLRSLEDETGKPVVTCGDFNVAHNEIDLKNPSRTAATRASPMRSGPSSASCSTPATPTPSAPPTPASRAPTAGGATASTHAEQCGLAHRRLPGERFHRRPRARHGHPQRHLRLGPLPRHAGDRAVSNDGNRGRAGAWRAPLPSTPARLRTAAEPGVPLPPPPAVAYPPRRARAAPNPQSASIVPLSESPSGKTSPDENPSSAPAPGASVPTASPYSRARAGTPPTRAQAACAPATQNCSAQ